MKLQNLGYGMYIGGIIYYNVYSIYFNGKKELMNFRKNKIYFNDEMESVVYGCQKDWYHNLLCSFFWPITLPFKMVPLIIFSMNDGKTEEDNNIIKELSIERNLETIKIEEKKKNIQTSLKKDLEVNKKSVDKFCQNINTETPVHTIRNHINEVRIQNKKIPDIYPEQFEENKKVNEGGKKDIETQEDKDAEEDIDDKNDKEDIDDKNDKEDIEDKDTKEGFKNIENENAFDFSVINTQFNFS